MSKRFFTIALCLSITGTLFSGYLSGVKLLTQTCAFNEPCPYFLGYPACWYGFAMFVALLALSLFGLAGKMADAKAAKGLLAVSALGTVFAGSFVVREVYGWFDAGRVSFYGFGLPTCVYGLVFYVALLILSARFLARPTAP